MQDIQNIPPPDISSTNHDDEFGNHSQNEEIRNETDVERIPLPGNEITPAPIEEPDDTEKVPINEIQNHPKQIL